MDYSSCVRNQRSLALDVGKGEAGVPQVLKYTLQLKLRPSKMKLHKKTKRLLLGVQGKKFLNFLSNALLLNNFNIETDFLENRK